MGPARPHRRAPAGRGPRPLSADRRPDPKQGERPPPVPQLPPRAGRTAWRLFLALPVPPVIAGQLDAALAPYREAHPDVRWLAPEAFHLTLLFLGAVDPAQADRLGAIARDVATRARPFEVRTGAGSGTLRGRDGVAWLTLETGGSEVRFLGDALASRIPASVVAGDRAPRRAPSAHLTVARHATQPLLDDLAALRLGPAAAAWTADRIVLFRSHLGPERAKYGTLAMARLGEPG
ncbi:MAG: RNA 2',3'-cyclic phosphodiesterase [Chloroflexota bacterium]